MVVLACGSAGGWRGCLLSCVLDFTLCTNEGLQEEGAWPLGWCCAAEGGPEPCQALQVPVGTAQHLLVCCRVTSAQLCWVPVAAPPGMGPRMGLRCSCQLAQRGNHTVQGPGGHTPPATRVRLQHWNK